MALIANEPLPAPSAVKLKIVTPRLEAARSFYCDLFRMQVVEEWSEPQDAGCILALRVPPGDGLIEIYHGHQVHDFSGVCLQFRVENLDEFIRSLPPGLGFEGPIARPWGSTYVYLTDPAGVPVVVFAGTSW
jgi:catechol 2,3-dioxygenase-like lactoylglutathione lyase family enzyme